MARGYSPPATALAIKPAITPRFDSFPTEALSRQTVGMDKQAKRRGSPKYDPAHMAWAVQKSYRCRDAGAKDVQLVLLKFGRWPRVACKGTHGPKQPMPKSNPPTKLRALIGVADYQTSTRLRVPHCITSERSRLLSLDFKHSPWATVGGMNKQWPSAIIARSVLLIRGGANPRTNTAQHSLKFPLCHVARQSAKGGNLPSHDAEAISQTFPT
ncbi:hypothetical protein THAOC_20070 [Thalassiosira oceanica]|uniref:Uncharacterized protein n=1 Tax=Thalassiosira oceanica TaxID=159749 RepID=K0S398_THAOC|nr:hypothetical protein THAOC_20070 [Thalassiosira oceanica]|eukprot:EJK59675.1 hypothetical protein THAOC_20070 [Thalassiosira oceanica]